MLKGTEIYSAMQTEKPIASFKKAVLGRVRVFVLDPFSDKAEEVILTGDPFKNEEGCFVHVWSDKQKMFFENTNRVHFKSGNVIPYVTKEKKKSQAEAYNTISDEEIKEVLSQPYFTLQNLLNKLTSTAPAFRFLHLARELEKSEKIIQSIEARIAELQEAELSRKYAD